MKPLHTLLLLLSLSTAAMAAPEHPDVGSLELTELGEGLRAHDLIEGEGPALENGDTTKLHITLWKADGALVFSTHDQGGAMSLEVGSGALIAGVDKGLVGMAPGGQRMLVVPSELGYGDKPANGAPGGILHVLLERIDTPQPATEPSASAAQGERKPAEKPPEINDWRLLSNGMKIATLREGTGATPQKDQLVVCEYTGWLAGDGTRFDSSLARSGPFSFPYGRNRVIRGWEKGIRDMKVGEKRVLYVPSYLAYGGAGQGGIPAYSDLIFEIELLELR